jgi:asparagine synthase (glutamine-hydrolysing)
VFGYAEIAENSAEDRATREYAMSLAQSEPSTESSEDCIGGSHRSATASMITVFLDGRPFRSDQASPISAAEIIDAYLRHGWAFLSQLNGHFAIALFDRRSRELTLAIDRMGISTMAWAVDDQRVVFATAPACIAHRPGARSEIRYQAIYEYFFFHMIPSPESIYSGVTKLGPGMAVTFSGSGTKIRSHWTPDFDRPRSANFEQLKERLHTSLRAAVETSHTGPTTGAFLSGGLDSSTVAGFLNSVTAEPAQTFSIGFGVESFDELEYARIANNHFGCVAHEYNVTPKDIVETIPIVAATFDEPFGNSSAIPTYACARYAKSLGMQRLLAGDGGDEIFAGNERYARQKLFELFNRVPATLRATMRSVVQRTIDAAHPNSMLRKLRSYVDQASIALPERYETWNFVYREGATVMFREDFMNSIETRRPFRHMKDIYESASSTDLLDRMLHYDWKFTLADNDLPKVVTMCKAAGIEVAFPMLDNRVVDVSVAVPSGMKMQGLELRSFFKRAMQGFLPDAVLKKTKHGFGLPFGQWLKTDKALADLVYGSLTDLKRRAIVKESFLDQLIKEHRDGHASYYGYVIWDLVMLEEWFKRQTATAGRTGHTFSRGA